MPTSRPRAPQITEHDQHGLDYAPIGYAFQADEYCLDCTADIAVAHTRQQRTGCTECDLDVWAYRKNQGRTMRRLPLLDRHDESTFDSAEFPKHIAYFSESRHHQCKRCKLTIGDTL
jgi:hypothetical protein